MADTFVAVTNIRHGEDDGEVTQILRGEEVEGLPKEVMVALWAQGSLAVKGTPGDPNTWPKSDEPEPTTPRFVEDVLLAQAASAGAPEGTEVPKTQPNEDVPKDPQKLLDGSAKLRGKQEKSEPESEPATTPTE